MWTEGMGDSEEETACRFTSQARSFTKILLVFDGLCSASASMTIHLQSSTIFRYYTDRAIQNAYD